MSRYGLTDLEVLNRAIMNWLRVTDGRKVVPPVSIMRPIVHLFSLLKHLSTHLSLLDIEGKVSSPYKLLDLFPRLASTAIFSGVVALNQSNAQIAVLRRLVVTQHFNHVSLVQAKGALSRILLVLENPSILFIGAKSHVQTLTSVVQFIITFELESFELDVIVVVEVDYLSANTFSSLDHKVERVVEFAKIYGL